MASYDLIYVSITHLSIHLYNVTTKNSIFAPKTVINLEIVTQNHLPYLLFQVEK